MWFDDVSIGDDIVVQVINRKGDSALGGNVLRGRIVELEPKYQCVRLDNGQCCHTTDRLLRIESAASSEAKP